jgi:hypothetical protein
MKNNDNTKQKKTWIKPEMTQLNLEGTQKPFNGFGFLGS